MNSNLVFVVELHCRQKVIHNKILKANLGKHINKLQIHYILKVIL